MIVNLRILYQYRELMLIWMKRDIKVRYKQTILGGVWAILQPLSLMVIFSVIFTHFVKVPTEGIPYPIFSYSALLPWTFFANSIAFAVPSLVNNMNLVTKIYFPREILPIAAIGASLVDFLVASIVFAGMLVLYRVPLRWTLLWIPLLLVIQIMLTLGVALLASAVNVFYRDIRFVIPLVVQLWMYATPIIYPVTLVPEWLRPFYMLNPMTSIIDSYRRVILQGQTPAWGYLGIGTSVALTTLMTGYLYFKRYEGVFADII